MTAPLFGTSSSSPLRRIQPVAAHDRAVALWLIAVCGLIGVATACAAPLGAAAAQVPDWRWVRDLTRYATEIGFAAPLLWFWARSWLQPTIKKRSAALLLVGAVQGGLSAWAVAAGYEATPAAQALQVIVAVGMAGGCLWTALDLLAPWRRLLGQRERPLFRHAAVTLALATMTVVAGALVQHQWIAILAAIAASALWGRSRQALPDESGRRAIDALAALAWVQAALGLFTALDHSATEAAAGLAVAHQGGGMLLICLGLLTLHRLRRG